MASLSHEVNPGSAHGHRAGGRSGRADARRAPGDPLPVLVLTGYLGAGKTTLLNHLLGGAPGLRIAAIVNDFGEIDVDATSVAGRVDSMVSLANGCVCCEVDASELGDTLARLADPDLGLDLAVIEASGLAEPAILSRMVHEVPRDVVRHAGMVQVVDAEGLDDAMARHPRLAAHLSEADLVVVNKCDLVDRVRFDGIRATIRRHAPRVAVLPAVRAAVPTGLLLGMEPDRASAAEQSGDEAHPHVHSHLHHGYRALTVIPAGPLHPRRVLAALASPPTGAYRAKGTLTLATADGRRRYEVALVGRRLELRAGGEGAGEGTEGLVVIGVDLDDDEVSRFLDDSVLTPGEAVDADADLGLHPYLVGDPDSSDVEEWIYDEQRAAPLTGAAAMLADPEDPEAFDPAFTP
ncbi:CobW family GTP-binding protein [Dietzia psychralcaliphila]|uniref:CobW family GTP-binding protein n=1 Tax=Dietzia psychralcaliphila TaxID=139021 RepID=UPI0027E17E78|nr:GTP-binding protein [Dietzia psychralcaliphila]